MLLTCVTQLTAKWESTVPNGEPDDVGTKTLQLVDDDHYVER
jgi:hypothetical protein